MLFVGFYVCYLVCLSVPLLEKLTWFQFKGDYCFVLRRQSILCSIEKICRLSDTEGGLTEKIDIYRHFERSIGKQSSNKIVKYLGVEPSSVSENVNLCSPD